VCTIYGVGFGLSALHIDVLDLFLFKLHVCFYRG